jgi:hypothetical protein
MRPGNSSSPNKLYITKRRVHQEQCWAFQARRQAALIIMLMSLISFHFVIIFISFSKSHTIQITHFDHDTRSTLFYWWRYRLWLTFFQYLCRVIFTLIITDRKITCPDYL